MAKPTTKVIQFRMHPRVFAALGSELVTNDVVAIIELVKNSYDALANHVEVRIDQGKDNKDGYIQISDDGTGMNQAIIEDVWSVVGTPYRLDRPFAKGRHSTRRVSGSKGLGRLSAGRLGKRLELVTKSINEPCWHVELDWDQLTHAKSLASCKVNLQECTKENRITRTGTVVRIGELSSEWDDQSLHDLREQLSRLVSPFEKVDDFKIRLAVGHQVEALIKPPQFLKSPPYLIKGHVDRTGRVTGTYRFSGARKERLEKFKEQRWIPDDTDPTEPRCGPFDFEIRAWDMDAESMQEISKRFDVGKATIRRDIRNYRGVSIYRDGILVLPKSDTAREWLGLDLRRVSKVGTRMSTSQLVGYASISASDNPGLKDTSDRERLVDNPASQDFIKLIQSVITILEDERSKDREEAKHQEAPFRDLFAELSPRDLVDTVNQYASTGENISAVVPLVEEYGARVEDTVNKIERRLVYYSRLASLGVLSAMLVHEVRNHSTTIGGLTRELRKLIEKGDSVAEKVAEDLKLADKSLHTLLQLADRFAPLASRAFRRGKRDSVLEDVIRDTIASLKPEFESKNISIEFNTSGSTVVAVDPGELMPIIFNLLTNSLYWLVQIKDRPRIVRIRLSRRSKTHTVHVQIDDSGAGIRDGDEERIFWPGVTRKSGGIGMGLTVASEIVSQYGGKMHLIKPGFLNGASFGFDLPLSTE
jgi:signal transduction histidine kinase